MRKPPSLFDVLLNTHWTQEQKALGAATVFMLVMLLFAQHGLPLRFLASIWRGLASLLRFKRGETGVQFGKVFLRDSDRVRHTHIVGSPGSGKTEAFKLLMFEDIRRGRGCFIIDAKGDRELYDEIRGFCATVGRSQDLKLISATFPEESSVWNPCGIGSASELQSKFLNSNVYAEPHYAKACELGLLQAFNRLVEQKPEGFALPDLVRELKYLAAKQKNENLEGLFYDFGSLAQSEWAQILGCEMRAAPGREISLLDIVQGNQILFMHLPTEGKSIQSSRIGRLLTQEIILLSGLRKSYPSLNRAGVFSIFIDEFDAFATESFITFLNKGRSSNFMIHIAHQTLSDLKRISMEFAGQVLGNCNIHVIFRQDDPDDAELWSRFMGTKSVIKRTFQSQDGMKTGASSNRESQEFIIAPDMIKTLGLGQCVLSVKTRNLSRKIKLPLPPSFRSKTPSDSTAALSKRIRGMSSENKTESERVQDLSADSFEIQTAKAPSKWTALIDTQGESSL